MNVGLIEGVKLGLVGANRSGKTTLLRAMTGEISLTGGEVRRASGLLLFWLRRNLFAASSLINYYVTVKLSCMIFLKGIIQMSIDSIVGELDAEIARLQQARALLSSIKHDQPAKPAKSTISASSIETAQVARRKRRLSPAARKRIAEAQRKRWSKVKASNK